ncbi:MAG: hypothetical protein AB7E55_23115 [Pigmentiphaga sp.]
MSITKDSNRQDVLHASVEISYADLVSGAASAAIELPGGAIVITGDVTVITPFNSVTSDVIDVGDSVTANRYLNDGNIHAAGRVALVPTGYVMPNVGDLSVTYVSAGGLPTAGLVRLSVCYVVDGRACTSQG